jgi:subtilase family serine protease
MTSTPACAGADPAITKVTTTHVTSAGLTTYTLSITVTNVGSSKQSGSTLDSVYEILDGEKKGEKGIPPLAAGASYTYPFTVQRAADGDLGSTEVDLHILMLEPTGVGPQNCSAANDSRTVVF